MAAALVIKQWKANDIVDENGALVHIEARPAGVVAWLMDLMGMGNTSRLIVRERTVTIELSSWSGHSNVTFNLDKITGVVHGTSRPLREAVLLAVVFGSWTFGIGAIVGVIYYFLAKSLTIGVIVGNQEYALPYKEAVVDGVSIGKEEAARVGALIQALSQR